MVTHRRTVGRPGVRASFSPLRRFHHPAQVVVTGFLLAIAVGTGLLSLPVATASGEPARFPDALFTATSAVCVTGLTAVDTGTHWSTAGLVIIACLFQIGGLGIMTLATLLAVVVSGRLGLRARLAVQAETKSLRMADVRRLVRNVVLFSLGCEAVTAVVLAVRFATAHGEGAGRAAFLGVFHAVSAFNNAGFAVWPDSLVRFAADPWICLPVALAVIVGGLGFPVVFELARSWHRPAGWTVLTRITLAVTAALLVTGTLVLTLTEWNNARTLGALPDGWTRLQAGFFAAVMPRSGGFAVLDIAQMRPESWLVMDMLMFVGGGSAGTAGGIKVTTFGLLACVVWAELRGEARVNVGRRRVPEGTQRQAVAIVLLAVALVLPATFAMMALTGHPLDRVLFEVISASATVGLSTGITPGLPPAAHGLLVALMFVGRIGPLTLGTALALRDRTRRHELPEERPIVG